MSTIYSFHYSPKTGNTSRCKATDPANCPYGGHASSLDAQEAFDRSRYVYETVMASYELCSLKKVNGKPVKTYDLKAAAAR